MIDATISAHDSLDATVRQFVFERAAAIGAVPQSNEIASELVVSTTEVQDALTRLAAAKVLILAPNNGDIWAANPFCAVASGFRVKTESTQSWGICAWDALGIVAAVSASAATLTAPCGDCGDLIHLEFADGELVRGDGVIHFAVPARDWWKNIGFA